MISVAPRTKQLAAKFGPNKLFGDDVDQRKEMSDDELEQRFDEIWDRLLSRLVERAEVITSEEVPSRLTDSQRRFFEEDQEHRSFRHAGAEIIVQIAPSADGGLLNQLWRVASSDTHPTTLFVNFGSVREREQFRELADSLSILDEELGLRLCRHFMELHPAIYRNDQDA